MLNKVIMILYLFGLSKVISHIIFDIISCFMGGGGGAGGGGGGIILAQIVSSNPSSDS